MGQLAQGFGMTDAASAAQGSLQQGGLSTALSGVSDVLGGIGSQQQFNYRAQVAANNAKIEQANADAALAAGQMEESNSKLRTGMTMAAQKAAQAANGVNVNVGSPAQVRQSTAEVGAIDAATIHYNAAREAYNRMAEAANFAAQSQLDKRAATGALIEGIGKGGASILSGASSLANKYAQFKLSGATGGGASSGSYSDLGD